MHCHQDSNLNKPTFLKVLFIQLFMHATMLLPITECKNKGIISDICVCFST